MTEWVWPAGLGLALLGTLAMIARRVSPRALWLGSVALAAIGAAMTLTDLYRYGWALVAAAIVANVIAARRSRRAPAPTSGEQRARMSMLSGWFGDS